MKIKILIILLLAGIVCLPSTAPAYEKNFPAGSIIIPMDAFYQPVDDMGHLETYGLAYYLLGYQDQDCLIAAGGDAGQAKECEHLISLSWVINDLKTTITGTDLVIEDTTLPRTWSLPTLDTEGIRGRIVKDEHTLDA